MTTTTVIWEEKEIVVTAGNRQRFDDALAEGWEPYGVLASDTWAVTHYLKRSRPAGAGWRS